MSTEVPATLATEVPATPATLATEVTATPPTIPITPSNSPSNTSLLEVINDAPAVLDNDYAIGTPLVSSSPETIDSDSDSDGVERAIDTDNPDSETRQLQHQIEQLTIRVKTDDKLISDLLETLQQNQNQYQQLVNNRKFCPWSWWQKASDHNYLTYGIVGLIVIIGGSKVIFR
jgi:hypothetical protein